MTAARHRGSVLRKEETACLLSDGIGYYIKRTSPVNNLRQVEHFFITNHLNLEFQKQIQNGIVNWRWRNGVPLSQVTL